MPMRFISGAILFNGSSIVIRDEKCCCNTTCCITELGGYPSGFPATLTVTISGACCSSANVTRTYNRNNSPPGGAGTVQYLPATNMVRCNGSTDITGNWGLNCGNNLWTFTHEICGQPTGLNIRTSIPMTLVSCDPLHLTGTGTIYNNTDNTFTPQNCCAGSFSVEFTE